jgi:hypothetical protein
MGCATRIDIQHVVVNHEDKDGQAETKDALACDRIQHKYFHISRVAAAGLLTFFLSSHVVDFQSTGVVTGWHHLAFRKEQSDNHPE